MKILLACERSAGHLFPALALAKGLVKNGSCQQSDIHFFVTAQKLKEIVEQEGFSVAGRVFLRRNIWKELWVRFFEARRLLNQFMPDQVIGFGGRDTFFLVFFAAGKNIRTAIYEPNRVCGKANFLLSFFVQHILLGLSGQNLLGKKSKVVGIPLLDAEKRMAQTQAKAALKFDQAPVVFCFGGSQGSAFLNKVFLQLVLEISIPCQIIHITGQREYVEISQAYNKIIYNKHICDFSRQMALFYSAADLVICRCGALTLAEVVFYQLPAVLIPLIKAGGHQRQNALLLKEFGAAFVFDQENFNYAAFKNTVLKLLGEVKLRKALKDNLGKLNIGVSCGEFAKKVEMILWHNQTN